MQDYICVTFQGIDSEQAEILSALLEDIGFEAFMDNESGVQAWIKEGQFSPQLLQDTLSLPLFDAVTYSTLLEERLNWNSIWESNFQPVIVADSVLVKAPFHRHLSTYPIELVIEPKMSFGTGHHETTVMMIETMLSIDFKGVSVLDLGCGTGILAILAAKLGATRIVGVDIEEWAVENTLENAARNLTPDIEVLLGDVNSIPKIPFQVILANINRNVVLDFLPTVHQFILPRGYLITSGFLFSDLPAVLTEATRMGLIEISRLQQKDWICLKLQKPY